MESMRIYISNILPNILCFFKSFLHLAITYRTLLYVLSLDLLLLVSYAPPFRGQKEWNLCLLLGGVSNFPFSLYPSVAVEFQPYKNSDVLFHPFSFVCILPT